MAAGLPKNSRMTHEEWSELSRSEGLTPFEFIHGIAWAEVISKRKVDDKWEFYVHYLNCKLSNATIELHVHYAPC